MIISVIKILFLLGFLILIHEGGHFVVAKICKIKVKEFAIGFGPIVWKKQGKETKYVLRLIPLGGFINMEGEEEFSDEEGSFSKASTWKKLSIICAGAFVNIMFALIVIWIFSFNSNVNISTSIKEVTNGYPAEKFGLEVNDEIYSINGRKIKFTNEINKFIQETQGESVNIKYLHQGVEKNIKIDPVEENGIYYIGVVFNYKEAGLAQKIIFAFKNTGDFIKEIGIGLKQLVSGKLSKDQFTGPVGISQMVVKTSGIKEFVYLMALISMSLGVTNLMPFPPLDGGKFVIYVIEGVSKKQIPREINERIQLAGFAILMMLSLYITYNDILRIF